MFISLFGFIIILFQAKSSKDYRSVKRVDFTKAEYVNTRDVQYTLFTHDMDHGKQLTDENVEKAKLDKSKPTVVLMYGWRSTGVWYEELKRELFGVGPHNIIFFDWSKLAQKSYLVACANLQPISHIVADFLVKCNVPFGNIHIIGKYTIYFYFIFPKETSTNI